MFEKPLLVVLRLGGFSHYLLDSAKDCSLCEEQRVEAYPSAPAPRAKHNTPLRELVSRSGVLALSSPKSYTLACASLWTSCELSV